MGKAPEEKKSGTPQQMMYNVEKPSQPELSSFGALCLKMLPTWEFEAFLSTLIEFSKAPILEIRYRPWRDCY